MTSNDVPNAFVIFNPVGGNVTADTRAQLESAFDDCGITYQIHETTPDEDLAGVVASAIKQKQITLVVAAGGDGTVSAVANAVVKTTQARTDVRFGILPLGTANLIAQDLGIPLNLEEACALLANRGQTATVDAMQIGDDSYFSHVSMGLYAALATKTAPETKQRFGRLAYVWSACQEIWKQRSWRFQLTVDGNTETLRASTIVIANVRAMGIRGLAWGEQISMQDGALDVCIVRARSFVEYGRTFGQLFRRQVTDRSLIRYLRAKEHVSITTSAPMPVRADGEVIGQSQVEVQVRPGMLRVVVPPSSDTAHSPTNAGS